uniref:5'-3' exoribonuclease n=1 Tax=Culicoides sonorensis TaxID=179676 RepID=A0A336MUE1_CULSO
MFSNTFENKDYETGDAIERSVMGVPAFFRWLSRKYPSVIIECVEKKYEDGEGNTVHEDATLPNPNGCEFDNLYLDMNGIIHPCTHPEDKPAPKNEDEMMVAIFECIDRLFNIVRPRKLLYMAIDGVAPRAKMNQQRSRRFRASKEAVEKAAEVARIREELKSKGAILPPEKPKGEHFDSNCITPGTPFMDRLSKCLQYYIHDRLNNNPAWKGIKVILSDANVPGEGEHKIMDYIRKQRSQPDHDPNTHHVLCGADADLIMLGLATHEANFTIIREEFLPNKPRPCDVCNCLGHESKDCQGLATVGGEPDIPVFGKETQFIFVRLSVLREYLERELEMPNLPFTYEFDRVLDDWVFMCFFVGNDFLPHLPSLEIREGAIDRLITLYKKCVYKTGGYLTDSGEVALERVEMIMTDLGYMEDSIFKERQKSELRYKENAKRRKLQEQAKQQKPDFSLMMNSQFAPTALGKGYNPNPIQNVRQEAANFRIIGMQREQNQSNQSSPNTSFNTSSQNSSFEEDRRGTKRKSDEMEEEEDDQAHDEVRLWESGFKERYYESKFDVSPENIQFRQTVALEYVRGLCWVLKYYYQGCASWGWYFPYHYAPFASDFLNISGLSTKFDKGEPFKPLEQLMGVFPAASKKHIPDVFAELMDDPKSVIIDFYPEDFKIDLNGKKFAWQGVALLPFVDEQRLFKALAPRRDKLTEEEKKRNTTGEERLYIGTECSSYKLISKYYEENMTYDKEISVTIDGMQGYILLTRESIGLEETVHSPVMGLHPIEDNRVITVYFRNPSYDKDFVFPARKLEGAQPPPRVLKAKDNNDPNYRPQIGFGQRNQQGYLDQSAHRALNHYSNNYQGNQGGNNRGGSYSSVAPPSYQSRDRRGYQQNQQQQRSYSSYNTNIYQNNSNSYNNRNNSYNSRPPPSYPSQGGADRLGGAYNSRQGGQNQGGGGPFANKYVSNNSQGGQQQSRYNNSYQQGRDQQNRNAGGGSWRRY